MARPHITDLRKLRKMSQATLARAAGLTVSEISRIECGYRDISKTEAGAIARALDVLPGKIDSLFLGMAAPVGVAAAGGSLSEAKLSPISGSLEEDPANFREMPDESVLQKGTLSDDDYRARLAAALKRTRQVLHTSKVPAPTWRTWREFERKVIDLIGQ